MTILDNLFQQAASDYKATNNVPTGILATVTTNQTAGFKSQTNAAAAHPQIQLNYAPGGSTTIKINGIDHIIFYPPQFAGSGSSIALVIRGIDVSAFQSGYTVGWQGKNFVAAQVDAGTNIVSCAVDPNFITISLCGYTPGAFNG